MSGSPQLAAPITGHTAVQARNLPPVKVDDVRPIYEPVAGSERAMKTCQ